MLGGSSLLAPTLGSVLEERNNTHNLCPLCESIGRSVLRCRQKSEQGAVKSKKSAQTVETTSRKRVRIFTLYKGGLCNRHRTQVPTDSYRRPHTICTRAVCRPRLAVRGRGPSSTGKSKVLTCDIHFVRDCLRPQCLLERPLERTRPPAHRSCPSRLLAAPRAR